MRRTKRMSALVCAALLLTGTACGRTDGSQPAETQTQTSVLQTQAETSGREDETIAGTAASETEIAGTEDAGTQTEETQTSAAETVQITLEAGLNSTDVQEVLTFYQLAAAKNDTHKYTKTLDLRSLDGGEGKVASYVHVFEPIAKKAVAKNTVTGDPLPGRYAQIRPEDWKSAEAVSDGTYTTIRVQVVSQTDDANGSAFEGSVGRSLTVLDGVDQAVNEMPGVSADFENGKVRIEYQNPSITVKVDNRTGQFVEGACKWTYRVQTTLESLDTKVLAFNVHLQNAGGVVDYTVSY